MNMMQVIGAFDDGKAFDKEDAQLQVGGHAAAAIRWCAGYLPTPAAT